MIVNTATLKACQWAQRYPRHLVLAQVLAQDQEYFQLVLNMIADGVRVILDNGAHEGVVCNLSEYYQIAKKLKPWCVVLPDLIGVHAIESRTRSLVFYRWIYEQDWRPNDFSVMYVPQGKSQQEVVDEYLFAEEYFKNKGHLTIIGLGDSYKYCYQKPNEDAEEVKSRLLQTMLDETVAPDFPIHILGGRTNPTKFYSTIERVIGIDSSDPCQCALTYQAYPTANTEFERATKQTFNLTSATVANETSLKRNTELFCIAYGAKFK